MIKLQTLSELDLPETKTISCGKVHHFLDEIFTSHNKHQEKDPENENSKGVTISTLNLIFGPPGAGKSTIAIEYLSELAEANPDKRFCFISAEMNEIQFLNLSKNVPKSKNLPTIFFDQWKDPNVNPDNLSPEDLFEAILDEGFDIILIDSYEKLKSIMKLNSKVKTTMKDTENRIFTTLKRVAKGDNKTGKCTAFLILQQVTATGKYRGDNTLGHDCDSTLSLYLNGKDRYLVFTKNRFSDVDDKIYFEINDKGVIYNTNKFLFELKFGKQVAELKNNQFSTEDESFLDDMINEFTSNVEEENLLGSEVNS